jgi:hypothetical protein
MGRGIEPDTVTRLAENLGYQRAGASLAVGPADVHRNEDLVRIAQLVQQARVFSSPNLMVVVRGKRNSSASL